MASKKTKKSKKSSAASKQLGEVLVEQRKTLSEKLSSIPTEMLLEFGSAKIGSIVELPREGFFSDWPDSFSNNGTWYKTWGKGGGDIAVDRPEDQILPSDLTSAIATVRQGLKKS